jgi:hypothetical protein
MFLLCHTYEEGHSKDLWLLDRGYKNHMIGNKYLIFSMDTSVNSEITLGDVSQVKSKGKGIVSVLSKKNQKKDIHDVYYVPILKQNMINVGKLMEHGCNVLFKGSRHLLLDKSPNRKLIGKTQMTTNKMFPLDLRSVNLSHPFDQNVSNIYDTLLWHARFGHLPFKSLSLLQNHGMVKGIPILNENDSPYESCILGKHKRDKFPTSYNK